MHTLQTPTRNVRQYRLASSVAHKKVPQSTKRPATADRLGDSEPCRPCPPPCCREVRLWRRGVEPRPRIETGLGAIPRVEARGRTPFIGAKAAAVAAMAHRRAERNIAVKVVW